MKTGYDSADWQSHVLSTFENYDGEQLGGFLVESRHPNLMACTTTNDDRIAWHTVASLTCRSNHVQY